jgi:hypothetical protein
LGIRGASSMDEYLGHVWEHLGGRIGGPLTMRFVLQPLVAMCVAVRSGIADGREGRPPYGWAVITDKGRRRELLLEGWKSVARIFVVAVVLDVIYQVMVFGWVYPSEALVVAFTLSCVPYVLLRGPAGRLSRWFSRA